MPGDRIAEVHDLLTRMVRIPSVTVRDEGRAGTGEAELAEFVATWLREAGIEVATQEAAPERLNVIGRIPGRDRSRALLLNSHLDTVEVDGMAIDPYGAEVRDGRLYGRGSCDAKGCLATFMLAARRLAAPNAPPPVDLLVVATCGEESGGTGVTAYTEALPQDHGIHAAVIGEPTELRLVIAHKGGMRILVETKGHAAHSSQPWEGDNAIYRMAKVIRFVEETLVPELDQHTHPLVGSPTMAATMISGGIGGNIIPPRCRLQVGRRSIPGEDPRQIWEELKRRFEALDPGHVEVVGDRSGISAVDTPADSPIVLQMRRALAAHELDGTPIGANYGTDGAKVAPLGIPVVVFGPGSISNAHQPDESVALAEVVTASEVVTDMVRGFDG